MDGLLTRDADSLGAQLLLAYVTDTSKVVTHTNAAGEATTYSVEFKAADESTTQTTTQAGQVPDSVTYAADHGTLAHLPGGTLVGTAQAADPRFGLPVVYTSAFAYQVAQFRSTMNRSRARVVGAADPMTATGLLLETTNTNGRIAYDSLDLDARLAVSRSPQGRRSMTSFDFSGNVLQTQTWSRLSSSISYDSVGQVRSERTGGLVDSLSWNALGQLSAFRRADGSRFTLERDSLGNLLSVLRADTLRHTFRYDAEGNPIEARLLGGRRYTFSYNAQGLLTEDSLASAGILLGRYGYNAARRMNSIARPGRNAVSLEYDDSGRLTGLLSPTLDMRVTYNVTNNLLATIDAGGETYKVDYYGQIPVRVNASGLVNGAVDYAYTADLWVSSTRIAGRGAIEFNHDADGLTTRGGQLGLTRDVETGAIIADTIGVVATTRTYDEYGALKSKRLRIAGQLVNAWSWERDSLQRIRSETDSGAMGTATTTYRYDVLDRLDQVSRDGVVAQSFVYDASGNRTATISPAGTLSATYASDDRIVSHDGQAISHDSAGARIAEVRDGDSLSYSYDDIGNLTRTSSGTSGTASFRYDAMRRRIQELSGGTVVRSYLYGLTPLPLAELNATGDVEKEFAYVSGDLAPDYLTSGPTTYYLVHDHIGSVRQVIDVSTGTVVQAIDYDAHGNIIRNTNPGFQPFGFAGGLVDLSGRTVHFGARDYDARTGRWLQPDPIGVAGGSNRYVYAGNDPVNVTDPSGLGPVGAAIGGAIGGFIGQTIGATLGAGAGAAVGTAVLPGVGTVALGITFGGSGEVLGGIAGASVGAALGYGIEELIRTMSRGKDKGENEWSREAK